MTYWPELYKRWIALSGGQISIQWIAQLVSQILIRWIVIYPVDSAIQRLNNRGLVYCLKICILIFYCTCSIKTKISSILGTGYLLKIAKIISRKTQKIKNPQKLTLAKISCNMVDHYIPWVISHCNEKI